MLTVAQCRAVLESGHEISDADLERIRDELYILARASADAFLAKTASSSAFERGLELLSESDREAAVERAAILEFDAGRPRDVAEREALAAIALTARTRRPARRRRRHVKA